LRISSLNSKGVREKWIHGEGLRQVAQELIVLIHELKGSLAIFSHTLEEIQGVLRYAADNLENPQASSRVLREIQSTISWLSDSAGGPTIVAERTEREYLRNVLGGLSARRRFFVTTAMKNCFTIPSFFRSILCVLPIWSRRGVLTKIERRNQETKLRVE